MLKVVFQQMRASPFSAMEIKSRLDLTEIFCDVDDFCRSFEQHCHSILQLTAITGEKRCPKGYTQCGGFYVGSFPHKTRLAISASPKGLAPGGASRFAYCSRMSLSEVMTIVIAFHGIGYKTFKEFYILQVKPHWQKARQRGLGGHMRLKPPISRRNFLNIILSN